MLSMGNSFKQGKDTVKLLPRSQPQNNYIVSLLLLSNCIWNILPSSWKLLCEKQERALKISTSQKAALAPGHLQLLL